MCEARDSHAGRTVSTAEGVVLGDAGDRLCGRIPVPHQSVAIEKHDAVGDVGERSRGVRAPLGHAEEPRVVDEHAGPARKLERQREVGFGVRRMRLPGDQ